MKQKKRRDPIPGKNATREELAEFWDTHSAADYWDELNPIKDRVAKNLSQGITIRFDELSLTKLRKKAYKKGIGPTTLARMWILDRLAST
ncbi:hypothetical protein HY950_02570 [Candidatus Gottesmanbacteria bacterium]|nr:hypothetical protein [Candidatus Gottesmanbacteria bacterium]